MAIDATPPHMEAPRAALRLVRATDGIRDDAERVIVPTTDALAPWLECKSLADDAIATADRIVQATWNGNRALAIKEANRLAFRATNTRAEAIERVGLIEPTEVA